MKKNTLLFPHSWGPTAGSPVSKEEITEKSRGILSTQTSRGWGRRVGIRHRLRDTETLLSPSRQEAGVSLHSLVLRSQGQPGGLESLTTLSPAPLRKEALSRLGTTAMAEDRKSSLMGGTSVPKGCPQAPLLQRAG